jgi:hypothetical protein
MLVGLPVVLLAFAQVAAAAPPGQAPAPASPSAASAPATRLPPAPDGCRNALTGADSRTIIVCAEKPQGYRIDPDVIKARREAHNRAARPKPAETMKENTCATVGPMGCRGGGIDVVSAGLVAAQMLARAAKGENVGQMFVTNPQQSEYELYQQARKDREAKDAEAAAAKVRAAARASQGTPSPPSAPVPQAAATPTP